jgi:EAL domain-containing protein (putative c-di-GMP-specific phosphodiesterase class I)
VTSYLKNAVRDNLLSLVYQPILDIRTGKRDAVEGLLRLRAPDGHETLPGHFIPVAELDGTINLLGLWAIETACWDLVRTEHIELVSINISPAQLKAPSLVAAVNAILQRTGISGSRIALEVTESIDIGSSKDVLRCISELRALGVAIWLDDFGTGFSSLSVLQRVDFDVVKVDRSLLYAGNTDKGYAMLKNIVQLIKDHGPSILIEGVETSQQLDLAQELGFNFVQGFYIGKPAALGQRHK